VAIFKINEKKSQEFGIILQCILVSLFFIHFLVLGWYFDVDYAPRISWISKDGEWSSAYSLGKHFFGDFLQIWLLSDQNNWNSLNIYPPFAVACIKFFTLFSYKPSLFIYLFLLCLGVLLPLFLALKESKIAERSQILMLFGVFSVPLISILDRGNLIGALPILFYLFLTQIKTKKFFGSVLLGIASAIKIYPLIYLAFLPKEKRIRISAVTITTALLLNFVTSFIWESPFKLVKSLFLAQSNFMQLNPTGDAMNFSGVSIILNLINLINPENRVYPEFISKNAVFFGLSLLLLLTLAANFSKNQSPIVRPFLGLSALQLIPTISYSYTRWWGIVIIALLLNDKFMGIQRDRKLETFVWVIVILNMALLNFDLFKPISILPTISFLGLIAFCCSNIKFNLIFERRISKVK
jgi:hypothetical protein